MTSFLRGLLPVALALLCAVTSPLAVAQVTLNLYTAPQPPNTPPPAQPPDCVVTTDSNGMTLLGNGSTALQASGASYVGTGCGGNSIFNATLSVSQSTTAAGTPVTATWYASQAATKCVFAGSAPVGGALGSAWTLGATACQGAACATTHSTSVNPTIAGNYNLAVVCTNDSGFAQTGLTATAPPAPPQPINFALTASPPSPLINTPFSIAWSVSGASSCTGSASLGGSSVSLPGWTDTVSIASPRSITAAQAGDYTLQLACANGAGTTTSQSVVVSVVTPAGVCNGPAGYTRQTTGVVRYTMSSGQKTADLTRWNEIWGHFTPTDTESPWPGISGSSPIITMNRNAFLALKFTVPFGVSPTIYGSIKRTTYNYGLDTTAAISPTCGDFSPPDPANCLTTLGGGSLPTFQTAPTGTHCVLAPGDYYLNVRATNPAQGTGTCSTGSSTCPWGTVLNFNP